MSAGSRTQSDRGAALKGRRVPRFRHAEIGGGQLSRSRTHPRIRTGGRTAGLRTGRVRQPTDVSPIACASGLGSGVRAVWRFTGLVVVLAAFPYYSGPLVRAFGGEPKAPLTVNIPTAHAVLSIQGMDCTACAALIEKNLARIRGVRSATVSFETKVAAVDYDPRVAAPETFVKAIEKEGYKVTLVQSQGQP